jgi:hypothetical protein
MRTIILVLAWITPAAIAGALGRSGIWGTGSAFLDYLIPFPVAGGIFHLPSFAVAAAIILSSRNLPAPLIRYLPLAAFAVFAGALALQLDLERFNSWLFTDYGLYGSPFRFDENPLYLFVSTDALWVGIYALLAGHSAPIRLWLMLPVIPAAVVGLSALRYQSGEPVFKIGGGMRGTMRGNEMRMVYTSASYDEVLFRDLFEQASSFSRPWTNPNAEHVAVYFVGSMQMLDFREFDEIGSDNTVATICLYEEDRSVDYHGGYYDCFADRSTVAEALAALRAREATGLGDDIDAWYSLVRFCDDVEFSVAAPSDVEREQICRGMVLGFAESLRRFVAEYGEASAQVSFVRSEAASRGLGAE